jgi:hypothetical protein
VHKTLRRPNLRKLGALAGVATFAIGISACRFNGINDAPSKSTASSATAWLLTQQQNDGGFEVAGSQGFETPDAILAIAENAQLQYGWDKTQAKNAVVARVKNGNNPLHAIDNLVDGGTLDAGLAAKIIVLVAAPLGLSPTAFDPDGDGGHTNLVSVLDAGLRADGSYAVGALNTTAYGAIAKRLVSGTVAPSTVTYLRNTQQASGGWAFDGSASTDPDVDSTAAAVQALVAAKLPLTDGDLKAGLVYLANTRQPGTGAWQSFGGDDPNSTSTAALAITAAGFDVNVPCWRNTVAPGLSAQPYTSPLAWLRSQQNPTDHHINSHFDGPVPNTFATTQTIEALRRGWLPVAPLQMQPCP